MGQYIHVGLCTRMTVSPAALSRSSPAITIDEVERGLSAHPVDLSLFVRSEDEAQIQWVLRDEVLDAGLVPFLKDQFLMMPRGQSPERSALLDRLGSQRGLDATLRFIEDEGGYILHRLRTTEVVTAGKWRSFVKVEFEQISYLMEGKALLECYDDLFHYLGRVLALQSAQHPIAGAASLHIC